VRLTQKQRSRLWCAIRHWRTAVPAEEKASATRVEETIQSILYEQRMEVRLRPGYVPGTRVVADPDTEHAWAREFNGELHVSEETFDQLLCTGCAAVNISVWLKR
jgi:hypothetical protein